MKFNSNNRRRISDRAKKRHYCKNKKIMVESKINVTVRIKPLSTKESKNDRNVNVW